MGARFANYGKCHPSPAAVGTGDRVDNPGTGRFDNGKAFHAAVKASLFVLAVENANCESYVTEKLLRAVTAGVVPVVRPILPFVG